MQPHALKFGLLAALLLAAPALQAAPIPLAPELGQAGLVPLDAGTTTLSFSAPAAAGFAADLSQFATLGPIAIVDFNFSGAPLTIRFSAPIRTFSAAFATFDFRFRDAAQPHGISG